MPQSSGFSCPHSTQSASIPVTQQQCYYIPTPLIMPVTSSSQPAPQFAPVQPSYPVTASAPMPSEPTAQLITIFQELLKKISQHGSEPTTMVSSPSLVASPVAPSVAPPAPTHHPLASTMIDLCKDPALTSQADAIIASLPILSSLASAKGKNKSDLSFMSTIKCPQLWPNHFVTRLDASRPAYGDLDMAQFVCGYLDCIRQSPIQLQPLMFDHLYSLMDLATCFQWSHYHINFCQNWTIFIRTIQNAVGTRHFNIGTVRTASVVYCTGFSWLHLTCFGTRLCFLAIRFFSFPSWSLSALPRMSCPCL